MLADAVLADAVVADAVLADAVVRWQAAVSPGIEAVPGARLAEVALGRPAAVADRPGMTAPAPVVALARGRAEAAPEADLGFDAG